MVMLVLVAGASSDAGNGSTNDFASTNGASSTSKNHWLNCTFK